MESESAKLEWEALMDQPVNERVRMRKAIENVTLHETPLYNAPPTHTLILVEAKVNLSDFKVGDSLILHKKGSKHGIKCTLLGYENEELITLDVFNRNIPRDINTYYSEKLIIDVDNVDLRPFVYSKFIIDLYANPELLSNSIINSYQRPRFENIELCERELNRTIKKFDLKLLPSQRRAILNSVSTTNYYMIQGPLGTGKSFVLGIIILLETLLHKRKVVIIGPNHYAINNVIGQHLKMCPELLDNTLKVGQWYNAPKTLFTIEDEEKTITNIGWINSDNANKDTKPIIFGLTPHSLYSSRAKGLEFDTLIIDEAGQMTIPLALMGMIKSKKVIFAGDHMQLAPIIGSEEISGVMRDSIFKTLLSDDNYNLLDITFRMCEPLCAFISDLFYNGKLKPKNNLLQRQVKAKE